MKMFIKLWEFTDLLFPHLTLSLKTEVLGQLEYDVFQITYKHQGKEKYRKALDSYAVVIASIPGVAVSRFIVLGSSTTYWAMW